MSTSKYFDAIVAAVLALGLLLTAAFMNGEALGIEKIIDEDAEQYEATAYFTANDLNGDWDASGATATVALDGTSARITGNGAYYSDGSVVITGAGYYVLSGTLTDGNIVVDAYDSSKVFLLLDGVDVYCSDDACLRVENAEKVFLTLAAGTKNRMESGGTYSDEALADKTGGTIFTHDDLTVNGSGSLAIVASYKHGIDANDDLKITGGTITVSAPGDGLHVNDSFRLANASLTISAGDDGIHSDTDVYIESGALLITECCEGVEAPIIEVAGGDILIYPTDDGFNANGGSSGIGNFGGGMPGNMGGFDRGGSSDGSADAESGGTSGERPTFGGGKMPDFNGKTEAGGTSGMPEPPEGFDGEMPQPPEGFDSEMPQPPEGFDGGMPDMNGGQQSADVSSDSGNTESCIRITGGNLMIVNENAQDADGLDSNGSIYIEGGTILVSLRGDGSNNAIDYGSENGGVAEISGGTIIAAGGAAMAETFDSTSTQPSIACTANAAAGTTVTLRDADGRVLLTWDVPCSFTHLTISCPDMTIGGTYTLAIDGNEEEITLEESVTILGSSSGMGGFGGGTGNFDNGMDGRSGGFGRAPLDGMPDFRDGEGSFPGRGSRSGREDRRTPQAEDSETA